MAVQERILMSEMTDEQITAIKRRIETFVKGSEFFDKLCNHVKWDRGTKTMQSRRVVKPRVKESDITVAVENVAPRPQKIAVETFQHSVDVYRDKVAYTAEDVLFGYDDIVKIAGDTLGEITTQKLDFIKGKPFFNSACVATAESTYLATLAKVAIILKKNGAKHWNGNRYLALVTPETLEAIRLELEAKGSSISEATKEEIDSGIVGHYGRWDFMECAHDLMYKDESTVKVVCMGKRPNGEMPVDAAKIEGVEVIHNPLGSGILVDADGNYTADDNKQVGSVAVNVNGLGCYVNDDLCIIDVEFSTNKIAGSLLVEGGTLGEADKTGFLSASPVATVTVDEAVTVSGLTEDNKGIVGGYFAATKTASSAWVLTGAEKVSGTNTSAIFRITAATVSIA